MHRENIKESNNERNKMKERNHFVWRHYLKPWTDVQGLIFCKREGKIIETGTKVLANERFFYKLDELTSNELIYIEKIFCNEKNKIIFELNKSWLSMFNLINELIKFGKNISDEKIKMNINVYITEFNENLHTTIENNASKYLDSLYDEDLRFYETAEGNIEFNIFLCEQYFRTKRMKNSMLSTVYKFNNINIENCWNIGTHILAVNLASTLSLQKEHFRFCLLKNNTDTSFITSGQPVINLAGDNNNPRTLTVNEFEYYYPITPKLAFLIGVKENFLKTSKILELKEISVKNYNAKMRSQCANLLFSNNRKELL
jgi:hypothetical protein